MVKKIILLGGALMLAVAVYLMLNKGQPEPESNEVNSWAEPGILKTEEIIAMKLSSTAFGDQGEIPAKFSCDGEDINPSLQFSEVPDGAKSLVLIMDDPDVPKSIRSDGMWDHWVVFNIPPNTRSVLEGQEPTGVPGSGTNGDQGYHGPCPPDREHRYFFKLYALDSTLDLPAGATKVEVETAMENHVMAKVELMGRYQRK